MNRKKPSTQSGFTLIEVAIVVIISGIILIPLVHGYEIYTVQKRKDTTSENLLSTLSQISEFQTDITSASALGCYTNVLEARLPCPSDRSLPPTDPNYGREYNCGKCSVADLAAMPAPLVYNSGSPLPVCSANGGFCVTRGEKTVGGVTTYAPVLVGGVPFNDIRRVNSATLSKSEILDGWGSQFTYAVTLSMTSGDTYGTGRGYLSVVDEHNNPTAGIYDDGDYLLLSHGPNQNGAFNEDGQLISICGAWPYGVALENENCNNDSKFIQGLGFYMAAGAGYYDDQLSVVKNRSGALWQNTFNGGAMTHNIYNTNSQDVGIKTDNPTAKVEVSSVPPGSGTVRAANTAKTPMICRKDGTDCFDINSITSAGSTLKCAAGEVMTGAYSYMTGTPPVAVTKPVCVSIGFPATPTPGASCGPTKWVHGIKFDGSPVCWP